jgi:hypothetical protein
MAAYFNTLEDLAVNGGYWVNLSSPATLTVSGAQVDASATPISLKAGWNLVAYLPAAAKPTATALASISSYLQEVNHLGASPTNMEPGKGYWIKVSQACTLTYPD